MGAAQTSKACTKCGVWLPLDAPQGLCPACLLERACLEVPADPAQLEPARTIEPAGAIVGRYRLLEQIGEGGFGVVYMAEQLDPVQRKVALKIIKAGMDTKEVIARFEAERQALALMDHPSIAQVYDGGTTGSPHPQPLSHRMGEGGQRPGEGAVPFLGMGRPYFVMELVRGIPVTQFCDQRRLDTGARLQLFMQVCKAVQHAHQKGIIHRDLKPSNILVTHHESEPLPKIIDFGVAKALGQKLTDKTLFTGFLRMVGTPAYMSPEQAEFTGMDVDTRSDIYSLGVLLYELLTGVTPFDPETMRNATLDEVRRMIRETDPPKPSTRLQTLGEKLGQVARHRHTDASRLVHRIRGDLDWVVMKCLEKDRRRRYETVNGLAMDVQRHLDDEPVVARPPSRLYEFQKTVRRHQFGFAATAAIIIVLSIGATMSTMQALRATRAEREQTRLREEAEAASELERQAHRQTEQQAMATRQLLYATDMYQAQLALKEGNVGRVVQLLDRHRPKPGETDLRHWEWQLLWLLSRGDEEFTLAAHSNAVEALAASPDGRMVASASHEPLIRLWDLTDRKSIACLDTEGSIHGVAFSPDGQVLAVCGDKGVELWDTTTLESVWKQSSSVPVEALSFSADGLLLAGASHDGSVFVLSPERRHEEWRIQSGHAEMWIHPAVTFSPTGEWLAAIADPMEIVLIDPASGNVAQRIRGDEYAIRALAFAPDGQTLAAGDAGGTVRLHAVPSGELLRTYTNGVTPVHALAFSVDGMILATAGVGQTICLWDPATGEGVGCLQGHAGVRSLVFTPDDRHILSGSVDGAVKAWRAKEKPERYNGQSMGDRTAWFQFAADSSTVLVWNELHGDLRVATSASFPKHFRHAFSVELDRLAFTMNHEASFNVISLLGDDHLLTLNKKQDAHFRELKFDPDGQVIAAASDDGVWLWNAASSRTLATLRDVKGFDGHALAFSPDGRRLVVGGISQGRCGVQLWDMTTFQEVLTLEIPGASNAVPRIRRIRFSRDGQALGVQLENGQGHLWRVPAWEEILQAEERVSPSQAHSIVRANRVSVVPAESNPAEAERALQTALDRIWQLRGSNHSEVGIVLVAFGGLFEELGRLDQAEDLFRAALALDRHSEEAKDLELGCLRDLALLLERQGRLAEAEDLLRESVGILQERLGERSLEVMAGLHQWVDLLNKRGKLDEAQSQASRLVEISQEVIGGQHPDLAAGLFLLASILKQQGNLSGAEDRVRQGMKMYREVLDPNDLRIFSAHVVLAEVLELRGKLPEAEQSYHDALATLQGSSTERRYPLMAQVLTRLGSTLDRQGRLAEAEEFYRQALAISRMARDEPHEEVVASLHHLAFALERQGKTLAAVEAYREALAMAGRVLRPPHRAFADLHHRLGHSLQAERELAAAGQHFYDALAVFQRLPAEANRDAAEVRSCYANLLVAQGRPDEALDQYRLAAELTPTNAAPWLDRARLNSRLGRFEGAAVDWARGIELSANTPAWNSARKVVCRELAGWPEVFSRVAESMPDAEDLWVGRGQYHTLRSQWTEAASAYARAFRARPLADEAVFEYAGALLLTGDKEGYRRICANLAAISAEQHDSFLSFVKARTCGLGPAEGVSPRQLVDWSKERLKDDQRPWVLHVLGLAYHRAGELELAIEQLQESNTGQWTELARVQNWLVMAMALHRVGKEDEARRWLAKAQERLAAARPKDPEAAVNVPVPDWIALEMLRREAEALLKDSSTQYSLDAPAGARD